MKTSTKAVVVIVVAFAAASALKDHAEHPTAVPQTQERPDTQVAPATTHRTTPEPGTTPRPAKQPASDDWNAVTEHMVHTTPGADLPIPWADGPRRTATCSNGSHAEWVGTSTAAEMCAPHRVIEQH